MPVFLEVIHLSKDECQPLVFSREYCIQKAMKMGLSVIQI